MEREEFGALWDQLKIHLLTRWNKLTGEDLRDINGSYDLFVTKIEEKYDVSRGEVEEEFRNWTPVLEVEDIPVRETESQREDFPVKKWVIAGILLAVLLGYLAMYNTPKTLENNPPKETRNSNDRLSSLNVTQDEAISEKVRAAFSANDKLLNEAKPLQIKTDNGVVTISGTVASEENKSLAGKLAEKIPGVISVDNQVEVKP